MKYCPLCDKTYLTQETKCPTHGAIFVATREIAPGTIIRDKYEIVRTLGQGGMGIVYLARHILRGRLRALKFLSPDLSDDPRQMRRFLQEAQIELRHPNIAEVVDLDQAEDGTMYIAMEYVEGPDLREALAEGPFRVERALELTTGVALGLGAAHAQGIIHRDVKPENIRLAGGNGRPEIPKLLDFGIAAVKENITVVNRTRGMLLTPEYAAPEQWKGMPSDQLDGRVDLYALGGVLHEMLTGRTTFQSNNTEGWMFQHLGNERLAPSRLRPELGQWPGLDAMVLRLLARERDDRPANVEEFLEELDAVRQRRVRPRTRKETEYETPPVPKPTPNPVPNPVQRPVQAAPVQPPPLPPRTSGPAGPIGQVSPVRPFGQSGPARPPAQSGPRPVVPLVPPPLPPPPRKPEIAALAPTTLTGGFKYYGRPRIGPVGGMAFMGALILGFLGTGFYILGTATGDDEVPGVFLVIAGVAVFGGLIYWLATGIAFTKVRVNYRSPFDSSAAAQIFKALKALGYKPAQNSDIYLTQAGGRPVLSFAMEHGMWERPEQVQELTRLGRGIAHVSGGLPLRMQMIDMQRTVRRELMVD